MNFYAKPRLKINGIILFCAAGLLLAGCAVGISRKFTISGGEVVCVPVYTEVPVPASGGWGYQDEDIVALKSSVDPSNLETTKELTYHFEFSVKRPGEFPLAIKIDDVSDAEATLLLLDHDPKLGNETKTYWGGYVPRLWSGQAAPQKGADHNLLWLSSDRDSVRIHRYTITMNTGKKIVAYYALKFLRSTKREMRAALR